MYFKDNCPGGNNFSPTSLVSHEGVHRLRVLRAQGETHARTHAHRWLMDTERVLSMPGKFGKKVLCLNVFHFNTLHVTCTLDMFVFFFSETHWFWLWLGANNRRLDSNGLPRGKRFYPSPPSSSHQPWRIAAAVQDLHQCFAQLGGWDTHTHELISWALHINIKYWYTMMSFLIQYSKSDLLASGVVYVGQACLHMLAVLV